MQATLTLAAFMSALLLVPVVHAGELELLSPARIESDTAEGELGNDLSLPAVSAQGRWIAFASSAWNLMPGQQEPGASSYKDVFLHDRQTGTNVLVSHAAGSPGLAASYGADEPSISADGRWTAYVGTAGNLVAGQSPGPFVQAYLYDRDTGVNTLVSHSTTGLSAVSAGTELDNVRISTDGNWVVFESNGTDLVAGLTGSTSRNVFLYERATGQILLVSRAAGTSLTTGNNASWSSSVSANGRYVAFQSWATNLVAGFSGSGENVYLFDRVTGTMTLVSRSAASPTAGAGGSQTVISADGSSVAFLSRGTNLVAGQTDTNDRDDAFLFYRPTGTNVLVSRSAASPTTAGNGAVAYEHPLRLSTTGAWVAFVSGSSNAVPGQVSNPYPQNVFLFERATSSLTLVSRSTSSPATAANAPSSYPSLSGDGRFVAFQSSASDLIAGQINPGQRSGIYLYDRTTGTSVLASGVEGSAVINAIYSWPPVISTDGAVVAYRTWADDLVAGVVDVNGDPEVALYDRIAGTSALATLHAPGMASGTPGGHSVLYSASADGRYAVLLSGAKNLVPGPALYGQNVFLVDRVAGTMTLVSHSSASATTPANDRSENPMISADGNWIVFNSLATDLVAGQVEAHGWETPDIFLYERATGTVTLVSHAAGTATTTSDESCGRVEGSSFSYIAALTAISADGRYIAFECDSTNLVAGLADVNGGMDIFLYDRVTGQTRLVSRAAASATTTAGGSSGYTLRISADGRYIAFASNAENLVAGAMDDSNEWDVFLHDRDTGQTLLVSRAAGTSATAANGMSMHASLSADGRYVAFDSTATNLVPGQTDTPRGTYFWDNRDTFLFDRVTGTAELISRAAGSATTTGNGRSDSSEISADGLVVAFLSEATNLVPGQSGPAGGVFVHDRVTRKMELISHSGVSRTESLGASGWLSLSADGLSVAFSGNGSLYVADRRLGALERVTGSEGYPYGIILTADGSTVLFASPSPFLAANDFNNAYDVFAYTRTPPAASDFHTVLPCRLVNTQASGQDPISGQTSILDVHGACGVPETATAVAVNVTVLQSTGAGRLALHPGNVLAPGTSTINFAANQTLANNAILPLALNGEGTLAITPVVNGGGTVGVILDIHGYFQ